MRTAIICALIFTVVNSSFLRDLETKVTINSISYGETTCFEAGAGTLAAAITTNTDFSGELSLKATFSSGVTANDITDSEVAIDTGNAKILKYETDLASAKTGVYKLKEIVDTADTVTYTFTLPETNPAFMITAAAELAETQTTSQSVTEGDEKKGFFTIVFGEAVTNVPVIYTANDGKTAIANCKVGTTTTNVECTPTKDEMEDGKKYTIHYQNGCNTSEGSKITSTTVEVTFTAAEEASTFMTLGKVALFALAFLF